MTVYFFYLIYYPKSLEDITGDMIEQFSFMYNMLSNYSQNKHIMYGENSDIYLYAITDKKKIAKWFEKSHDMRQFKKVEKEITVSEWIHFSEKCEGFLLEEFANETRSFDFYTTKLERACMEDFGENLEQSICSFAEIPYSILKREFVEALDVLLYTRYYQSLGPDAEFYDYNFSYGCSPEGQLLGARSEMNWNSIYILLFDMILVR